MRTFRDSKNREWVIELNVYAIGRVRDIVHLDLLDISTGNVFNNLMTDPVTLCNVIYCLIKPQADDLKVSDEDFGRAMAGDPIDKATTALLEELENFFPSQKRDLLQKALGKVRQLESRAILAASKKLEDPELERKLDKILGESFGNSPESSDSTPDPSPSDNS